MKRNNKASYTEHTIGISKSSIALREELFSFSNILGSSKEQQLELYNKDMEMFLKRTVQKFPKYITIHKITKYQDRNDVFTLEANNYECIVLFIHGGAWTQEISASHVLFCDRIADTLNAKVVIPLYPLAPEATYKDTYAMLNEVYDMVSKEDKPIIVIGDSAGGTCSLQLVLQRRDANKSLPKKVVAIAPCVDLSFSNPEIDEIAKVDGFVPKYYSIECAKLWTNGASLLDPSISPISANYDNFPDTMVILGNYDILYADNKLFIKKLKEANVNVTYLKGEGFWHVFPVFTSIEEFVACSELIRIFINE